MDSRKKHLNEDDRRLFRSTVADVKPLNRAARAQAASRTASGPSTAPRTMRGDRASAWCDPSPETIHATADQLSYASDGVSTSALRRLHQVSMASTQWLDLHGMTASQARAALRGLLAHAQGNGVRHIGIVHGKGLQSGRRGPVLKAHVASWLRQSPAVLAYVSARPEDGGTGAVYVRLKRDRSNR